MRYDIKTTVKFDKWLRKLKDIKAKITILRRIDRLCDGDFGDFKRLEEGLFELRIFTGAGYRVYFTIKRDKIIILLVGGDKATQKRDIKSAKKILGDIDA